ncbi:hypothetical protein IT570_01135 [Candidatus Sumerlaeota bacterium]|nr:hypothetical protein [Candidatus Sumerlaeota bacterium]
MNAINTALFATFGAILLLNLTEAYDPAGSPIGWLIMLGLLAAHLPLLQFAFGRAETPRPLTVPRSLAIVISIGLVACATALAVHRAHARIFETAVIPDKSAQLGLAAQVAARMGTGDMLYGYTYRQDSAPALNSFPVGGVVPFALARRLGWDWRYASLMAMIITSALIVAGLVRVLLHHNSGQENTDTLPLGVALGGCGWLVLSRTQDYFNWGHVIVLWPFIALLGLALSTRRLLLAALATGLLASMNAGWLLVIPVLSCYFFAERRRGIFPLLAVMLLPPIITYTLFLDERNAFLPGVFGNLFAEGWQQERAASWRYPSLHALGDWLHLRPLIYLLAVAAIAALCLRMARTREAPRRIALLVICAFIITACGPTTYFFHWMSYAVLLASITPALVPIAAGMASSSLRVWQPISAALLIVVMTALIGYQVHRGFPGTINRLPEHRQGVERNLLAGFNVRSEDHAWGKSPDMAVGFTLDRREAGLLELHLGTIAGEFTPMNRTVIRVNGRDKGVFRALPGDYRYARVPLSKDDVMIGFNVVELDASWARTPRSLGVANDDRMVSVNYLGMRYLPRDEVQLAARP